jgi:hypothetical protein
VVDRGTMKLKVRKRIRRIRRDEDRQRINGGGE